MKKVWIGLFVVVAAYACGDTAGDLMGGALQDAGSMLQDAGEQMQDGGAQAQNSKNVTCDLSFTSSAQDDRGSLTTYYALVDTGGKGFPDVAVRKVYEDGYNPWLTCFPRSNCSALPSGKLVVEHHHQIFIDGKAFVSCGQSPGFADEGYESVTIYY